MNKILFTLVLVASVFVTSLQAQQKSPPPSAKKANTESFIKLVVINQNLKDKLEDTKEEPSTGNPKGTENTSSSYDEQNDANTIVVEEGDDATEGTQGTSPEDDIEQASIVKDIKPITGIIILEDDTEQGVASIVKDIKPITGIIILDDGIEYESVIKDIKPITDIIIHLQSGGIEQDVNPQNYLDGESIDESEEDAESLKEVDENANNDGENDTNSGNPMGIPTEQIEENLESDHTSLNSTELVGGLVTEIKAYPNPATTSITLAFSKTADYDINVFNVLGQMKQSFQTGQTNAYQIDVANWIPGDYIIQIIQGNELITKRIVVTR